MYNKRPSGALIFEINVYNTKQNQADQITMGAVSINSGSLSGTPVNDLRKNGKIVSLTLGFVPNGSGSGLTLFALPSGFRPNHDVYMVGSNDMKATIQGSTGNILMDIPEPNVPYYVTTTFIV